MKRTKNHCMRHFLDLRCEAFMVRHPKYSLNLIKWKEVIQDAIDDATDHIVSYEITIKEGRLPANCL